MNSVEARIDVVNQHLDPLHESVATGVAKVLEIAGVGILYGDHAAIFDMGKSNARSKFVAHRYARRHPEPGPKVPRF